MAKDDAKISVGIEGADEAAQSLKKIFDVAGEAAKKFGTELLGGGAILGSLGAMKTAFVDTFDKTFAVNVGKAADEFKAFTRDTARASVMFGESVETLKGRYAELSRSTGISDEKLAMFSKQLALGTHDVKDNSKAIAALAAESVLTGRSLEEMGGLGTVLHNQFGVAFEDVPAALEAIRGKAEALGTVGGASALQDRIIALGNVIGNVSIAGKKDFENLVDFINVAGKNLRPEQQKQAQQRILGFVATNTEPLRRQLKMKREDFYDDTGAVKDPLGLAFKLQQDSIKRYGGRKEALRIMSQDNNLGPTAAAALFALTDEDVKKSAAARRSASAPKALEKVTATPLEQQAKKEEAERRRARETVGSYVAGIQPGGTGEQALAQKYGKTAAKVSTFGLRVMDSVVDATIGRDRLYGAGLSLGLGGELDTEKKVSASTEERKNLAKAMLVAVDRAGKTGTTASDELGKEGVEKISRDPVLSGFLKEADKGNVDVASLQKAIVEAIVAGMKGANVTAQVDVVDSTGAPAGAIQAYQSKQRRQ